MSDATEDTPGNTPDDGIKLAVLPFRVDEAHRTQAYFGAGVGEDILDKLDGIDGLTLAARATSWEFRNADPSGGELLKRLKVDWLVTGIVGKDGDVLKLRAQLSRTDDGTVAWSQTYERPLADLFAVIADVCRKVATALGVEVGKMRPPVTRDFHAFDCFLHGLDHSRDFGNVAVGLALDMHQLATEADPEFGLAFSGVAEASATLYLNGERTEAHKTHTLEASARAVELMPDHPRPHIARATALFLSGESEAGMAECERAIELDAMSYDAHYNFGRECFSRGQIDKAMTLFEKAVEIRPEDYQSTMLMAQCYEAQDQKDDAERARRRALDLAREQTRRHAYDVRAFYMGANALVALGETKEGLEWAERAETMNDEDPMLLYNLGCIHSLVDDNDVALDLLERAVGKGYSDHGWMSQDDDLKPLRETFRFKEMIEKMVQEQS
jgi:adenylate cyclase